MSSSVAFPDISDIVNRYLEEYVLGRCSFYENELNLQRLLSKNLIMAAMRQDSITGVIDELFHALESSSEEGVWGTTMENILVTISGGISRGDLLLQERNADTGDTIWYVEIKSSKNTLNSDSQAQVLRKGRDNVTRGKSTHSTIVKNHHFVLGIVAGTSSDKWKTYPGTKVGTEELRGFEYRELVGKNFADWILRQKGHSANIDDLLVRFWGQHQSDIQRLRSRRSACYDQVMSNTRKIIDALCLDDDIACLSDFIRGLPTGNPTTQGYGRELETLISKS
jgi:hypothetical protein